MVPQNMVTSANMDYATLLLTSPLSLDPRELIINAHTNLPRRIHEVHLHPFPVVVSELNYAYRLIRLQPGGFPFLPVEKTLENNKRTMMSRWRLVKLRSQSQHTRLRALN
jgi:hypothetical protein